MTVNYKATNLVLTSDINEYLNKKLDSLGKFIDLDDEAVVAQVEVGKTTRHHQSGEIYRAEINIRADGKTFRAVSESTEILSAIDMMKDQITQELRRYKTKKLHFLRHSGQKVKKFLQGFYKRQ